MFIDLSSQRLFQELLFPSTYTLDADCPAVVDRSQGVPEHIKLQLAW